MRGKIATLLCASVVLFFLSSFKGNTSVNAHDILTNVLKSINGTKTLAYTLDYKERRPDGTIRKDSSFIKYQKSPTKVYMKMANGAEILWGPDMNNGNALINPNAFPYFDLNLDPTGSTMRKNQHHGIDATGYDYFGQIIQYGITRAGKDFDSHFLYLGDINFSTYHCYNISFIEPAFKYVSYTVQQGETILTIAKKLYLNEFMIQQYNNLSSFTSVKAGQTIMVPVTYGKIITLYVDKTSMLPVLLKVEDDKGLFEEYHFLALRVNPTFQPEEFTKGYKGYHF